MIFTGALKIGRSAGISHGSSRRRPDRWPLSRSTSMFTLTLAVWSSQGLGPFHMDKFSNLFIGQSIPSTAPVSQSIVDWRWTLISTTTLLGNNFYIPYS